ncbi:hypothetical protein J437_LFUL005474 [Ladona fulva]|uniref:DDE Tnp4 domain-containing protein n=1 Tax=Ladona fulva TaxID=123851 RepID=A0A8K0JWT7_LADFU|nr:hypothetical protein J437_LFUL005474 [Ladona fulva]
MSVSLRYLATGNSFYSLYYLYYEYLIGITTIRAIVRDACDKLWMCFRLTCKIIMRIHGKDFPNCLGAVDGKHIQIKKQNRNGSQCFNYKNYFSVILLSIADADYCITSIDIESYVIVSDLHAFQCSKFDHRLEGQLHIHENRQLPNDDCVPMPFVLIGDKAFTLSEHLLRPYE